MNLIPIAEKWEDAQWAIYEAMRRAVDGTASPLFVDVQNTRVIIGSITASGSSSFQVLASGGAYFPVSVTAQNVSATGLNIDSTANFRSAVTVTGTTQLLGNTIAASVTAAGLNVTSTANFRSDVGVTGAAIFLGNITAANVTAAGLNITSTANFRSDINATGGAIILARSAIGATASNRGGLKALTVGGGDGGDQWEFDNASDNLNYFYSTEAQPRWRMAATGPGGAGEAGLLIGPGGNSTLAANGCSVGLLGSTDLGLFTSNGTSQTERARITSGGRFGLGVTAPTVMLDVSSTAGFRNDLNVTGATTLLGNTIAASVTAAGLNITSTANFRSAINVTGEVIVSGAGTGITFPDGTKQTTAAAGASSYAAWQPTFGGFSTNIVVSARYVANGKQVHAYWQTISFGTSNATTFTFTLPLAPAKNVDNTLGGGGSQDNGSYSSSPPTMDLVANNTTVSVFKDQLRTAWTASGNKGFYLNLMYESA